MHIRFYIYLLILAVFYSCGIKGDENGEKFRSYNTLEKNFDNPPIEAQLRAYWWWVNGNATKESITRDLEEMKSKGFGGAVLCDMDRSYIGKNKQAPHGPDFMSDEWRDLYKHTLKEANRLGLEISLNITSGWALGGPMIELEEAPKKLVWTKQQATGPSVFDQNMKEPEKNVFYKEPHREHEKPENEEKISFYKDIAIVAYPKSKIAPIKNWRQKALHNALHRSAPASRPLLEFANDGNEPGIDKEQVIDLSDKVTAEGNLKWDVPEGEWEILRLGYTINNKAVIKTSSEGWGGYALDVFDAKVFEKYWEQVVEPLIEDAGDLTGSTLKYLHTDSWEIEPLNWTPLYPEEFRKRHGYDILPFIPTLVGDVVESRESSNRFLHDFRKTFSDMVIDNHYALFKQKAHAHNLLIHPESGGPHAVPIDAQRSLGYNDIPMSEFWAKSPTHRVTYPERFFVKQPASAAHTYGKKIVMAEGQTTIGPHWHETIWDNLKPSFDKALCEGLNLLVWHAFSSSPKEMGIPGQDSHAGTHLNPNITWWSRSEPFMSYINRSQAMLQQGLFVADVLYYYGDHAPNFAQLKSSDPTGILPGYDYDVATEEVILERLDVENGRIVLPDGMSYYLLALPDYAGISLPVLKKLKALVEQGATIVGSRPSYVNSLTNTAAADEEFTRICNELWGENPSGSGMERSIGKGRMISGMSAREVLDNDGIVEDFSFKSSNPDAAIDYIHRADPSLDIFFISNQSDEFEKLDCSFRVSGKQPEFWDAVTGKRWPAKSWMQENEHTVVPVELPPYGSLFVVFADEADPPGINDSNFLKLDELQVIKGDWQVEFDEEWGGPSSEVFPDLISWTESSNQGIKYYSGTATYKKKINIEFDFAKDAGERYFLDLGNVKELAEVRLNGKNLGITWSPPFRVEITEALLASSNELEIDVVNFWPNRVLGDQKLPENQRFTKTNLYIDDETPLMRSGLLGPVRLLKAVNGKVDLTGL